MLLSHFLDAAYALLVEEYQRIGVNLMEAVEKVGEYREGSKEPEEEREIATEFENQRSLAQLESMMKGVR